MTLPIVLIFSFFISKTIFGQEARINTDDLNVRTGPGINYEKITKVHQDESYPIIQKTDKWVEIELSNGTGWVTTDYITIINHEDRKSTRLNSSHVAISYAVFCLKKKQKQLELLFLML